MKFIIYNPKTNLFDFFITSLIEEVKNRDKEIVSYINILENKINESSSTNVPEKSSLSPICFDKFNVSYKTDILLIIINPHFIFDYPEIKNELIKLSKEFKYKIFYITEPINFIIEKKVFQDIIKLINPFALWTYTYENFNKLKVNQPIFKIFPNNNSYHFIDINPEQIKSRSTNKIVFIGNITDNRKDICNSFNDKLINYNNSWSKEEWSNILSSHLFYLNIHRRVGCKSFESFRIVPILANGGFIISERCNEEEELLYRDYNIIFVERDQLLDTFLKYQCYDQYQNYNKDIVYDKCMLFRNKFNSSKEINEFMEYYKNII